MITNMLAHLSGLVGFEPYGMTVPKTVALPLGYNPKIQSRLGVEPNSLFPAKGTSIPQPNFATNSYLDIIFRMFTMER